MGARLRLQRGSSRAGVSLRPQGVKLFPLQLEVQRAESTTKKLNLYGWIVPRARAFQCMRACGVRGCLVGWLDPWLGVGLVGFGGATALAWPLAD